uniref:Helicase conserved C-terminal domain-containing protein n=1 Tax=Candidatus Kentrum sp. TUN TaxID=2126343 RepID=A0A451ABD1_9GAMM|nr:MAG: Helicase conserved C-terminal domain-containing protein [Candidatus Kentron sp. TUN]
MLFFSIESHKSEGAKIPDGIDKSIHENLFIPKDFDEFILEAAPNNEPIGKLLKELKEPRPGGKDCIPWLGETLIKERIIRLCARGKIAINLRVPAGLVNNWHRELNEVFNLDFEVFGAEGDVTDRKSNAFAKHHRLIASVDTLKRRARINRLKEALPWDLVVFDEAHHLSAYKNGRKVRKTENYKLGEALRDHTRDLILLSATPHQGDYFRFWMLIQLLDPTLFKNPEEMVEERHRLNQVVYRRTKADACTAAGREGINLQFSRILFNFDLPWNPMDVEQRIGRIHRYGQKDTAQVYNLVLSDTIEGRIFLLLTDKLDEIARTLGKVDEHGNVTEDLRGQILGQLNDRLSYDQLYREALSDPELKRTREELEAAMSNAREARKVVFELFQDLDRFSLDDYKPLADIAESKSRIVEFLRAATRHNGGNYRQLDIFRFELTTDSNAAPIVCTLDRELAQDDENVELIGIDHPIIERLADHWWTVDSSRLGAAAVLGLDKSVVLSLWLVHSFGGKQDTSVHLMPIAVDWEGRRVPSIEKQYRDCFNAPTGRPQFEPSERAVLLHEHIEPTLQHELGYRGIASPEKGYFSDLLAWIEVE